MQIRRFTFIAAVAGALAVGLFAGAAGAGGLNAVFAHLHAINTLLTGTNITFTAPADQSSLTVEYMPPPDGLDTSVNIYADPATDAPTAFAATTSGSGPVAALAVKTTLGPKGRNVALNIVADANFQVGGSTPGPLSRLSDLDRVARVDGLLGYVAQNVATVSALANSCDTACVNVTDPVTGVTTCRQQQCAGDRQHQQ